MNRWVAALTLALITASCANEAADETGSASDPQRTLPPSNGTHNDLTVICPDDLWEDFVGLAVAQILGAPAEGLPQTEPRFSIIHVSPERVNDLLRKGKSVIQISIIPDSSAVFEVRNGFARPQLVAHVIAPSAEALPNFLNAALPKLAARFASHDAQVLNANLKKRRQLPLPKEVKNLGISDMTLPEGFEVTLSKPGLVILRNETKKSLQYIILTRHEANDSPTPEADVVQERDAILRQYFEGAESKSHLATELRVPPAQQFYTSADGHRALRTLGLFKTVGGFGGGPFVSHRIFDDPRGLVGTADALIYAPSTKKIRLQMELDLITASVRWGDLER